MTTLILVNKVTNLLTGEVKEYTCQPREAVIAAYAQDWHYDANGVWSPPDFETWEYENKYGSLVEEATATLLCGDWCVYKVHGLNEATSMQKWELLCKLHPNKPMKRIFRKLFGVNAPYYRV